MPDLLVSPTMNETFDTLLNGKVRVVQEKNGYRFSMDAVLLAGFARLRRGDRVVDLGTGIGIIPLILGTRGEGAEQIVGVEIQEKLVELAQRNVRINNLESLIHIHHGDIKCMDDVFHPSSFNVVVANPPYYRETSGRINPSSQKAIARHEVMCTIDDVLQAAVYLLKEGGSLFIIFPSHRSITLFDSLRKAMLEPKMLRWVHSRSNEEAKFILAEAHKGGGEGVEVLPPFFVYAHDAAYTSEMKRLYSDAIMS
jgi:tRNA1Val (adenine37-N6)-methyltransferase